MKKTLFLFTDYYPYGRGEQYLDNEMPYLVEKFDKIYFVPINFNDKLRFDHPKTEVLDVNKMANKKKDSLLKLGIPILKILLFERKYNKSFKRKFSLKEKVKTLYNAFQIRNCLIDFLAEKKIKESDAVFYSYWFFHWSLSIALLKAKRNDVRVVSRAHLGDLYLEFEQVPFFTAYKLNKLDNIAVISEHAQRYFAEKFPSLIQNVAVSHLGVNYKGGNPCKKENIYTIVSCSNVRKEKCVDKIAQVINLLSIPVKWVHFGDGPDMERVQKEINNLKTPENIKIDLRGWTKNSEVMEFYKTNSIELFINLSYEEGVPVSLMEAISFGIPVLGTNVFGTPEVANEITGGLVEVSASVEEVAKVVLKVLEESKNKEDIIKFWDENFNSDKNYSKFVQQHLLASKSDNL